MALSGQFYRQLKPAVFSSGQVCDGVALGKIAMRSEKERFGLFRGQPEARFESGKKGRFGVLVSEKKRRAFGHGYLEYPG